jgi:hypothetical protein
VSEDWVETTAAELEQRAGTTEGAVDPHGSRLLLDMAREELGLAGPAELTAARLRELLLEVFPDIVVMEPGDVPSVLSTVGGLVDHLAATGRMPAEQAAALRAEVAGIEPEFTEVMAGVAHQEQERAGEVIAGMMLADGVELDDDEAVERWLADFERLPEEERYARAADYLQELEDLAVPAVRLAPVAELARAARAGGLTREVLALAERPADPAGAAAALGVPEPEAQRLWWAAAEAGVLAEDGPGPAFKDLSEGDDDTLLAIWVRLLDAVVVDAEEPPGHADVAGMVRDELTGVLIHLYEQERAVSRAELSEAVADRLRAEHAEHGDPVPPAAALAAALGTELDALTRWGVVETAADGGQWLTPLGVWGVRELLLADGFTAPAVGDYADAAAAELVAALGLYREEAADEEISGWLAGRPADGAARELLEVMAASGPGARSVAATVLYRLGADAEPVVRAALDDPGLRPYAALWLHEHGDTAIELASGDMIWMFVDSVAGMLENAEPAEAIAAALRYAPPDVPLEQLVADLWQVEHPQVADVLEALGAHHPDKQVAKTARRAAFKARSRTGAL